MNLECFDLRQGVQIDVCLESGTKARAAIHTGRLTRPIASPSKRAKLAQSHIPDVR
jgi:hypothetical protein